MDSEQFSQYLKHIDLPPQLTLQPDAASLYLLYRAHLTRFSYNNLHEFMGGKHVDFDIASLLETMPTRGGVCYKLSELLFAVLQRVGYDVRRVVALYHSGWPPHVLLMVKIEGDDNIYICDPGLGSKAPR